LWLFVVVMEIRFVSLWHWPVSVANDIAFVFFVFCFVYRLVPLSLSLSLFTLSLSVFDDSLFDCIVCPRFVS